MFPVFLPPGDNVIAVNKCIISYQNNTVKPATEPSNRAWGFVKFNSYSFEMMEGGDEQELEEVLHSAEWCKIYISVAGKCFEIKNNTRDNSYSAFKQISLTHSTTTLK